MLKKRRLVLGLSLGVAAVAGALGLAAWTTLMASGSGGSQPAADGAVASAVTSTAEAKDSMHATATEQANAYVRAIATQAADRYISAVATQQADAYIRVVAQQAADAEATRTSRVPVTVQLPVASPTTASPLRPSNGELSVVVSDQGKNDVGEEFEVTVENLNAHWTAANVIVVIDLLDGTGNVLWPEPVQVGDVSPLGSVGVDTYVTDPVNGNACEVFHSPRDCWVSYRATATWEWQR